MTAVTISRMTIRTLHCDKCSNSETALALRARTVSPLLLHLSQCNVLILCHVALTAYAKTPISAVQRISPASWLSELLQFQTYRSKDTGQVTVDVTAPTCTSALVVCYTTSPGSVSKCRNRTCAELVDNVNRLYLALATQ